MEVGVVEVGVVEVGVVRSNGIRGRGGGVEQHSPSQTESHSYTHTTKD